MCGKLTNNLLETDGHIKIRMHDVNNCIRYCVSLCKDKLIASKFLCQENFTIKSPLWTGQIRIAKNLLYCEV